MKSSLASLEQRVGQLRAKLDQLRPKQAAPPLIITFCRELNKNAPSGTRVCDDEDDDEDGERQIALLPPGCTEKLPEGVLTLAEWMQWKQSFKKEKANVQ